MKHRNILDLMAIIAKNKTSSSDFILFLDGCDPALLQLWQFIINCDGRYMDNAEDRKSAFHSIFGKKSTFEASKIRNLVRLLRKWLEYFILIQKIETTAYGQRFCAENYQSDGNFRKMKEANDNALKIAKTKAEETQHYIQWAVNRDRHFYGNNEMGNTQLLQKCNADLDTFYFVNKLKNIIEEISSSRCQRNTIDEELKEQIHHIRKLIKSPKIPLITVQLAAIDYFMEPTWEDLKTFKRKYLDNLDALYSEKQYLLISLINALTALPDPNEETRQEYLVLYKFGIENNLLIEKDRISSVRFDNIVFISEVHSDYNLIEQAIENLGPFIENEKEKKRSLLLAKAYVCFGKKQYAEAMANLRILEKSKDLHFYFVLKKYVLDFKCAYEKAEDKQEAFLYLKNKENCFRKRINIYRKNDYINDSAKQFYLNFFNLLCKIANSKNPKNSKSAVQKKLRAFNGMITELKWSVEKIAEIKE